MLVYSKRPWLLILHLQRLQSYHQQSVQQSSGRRQRLRLSSSWRIQTQDHRRTIAGATVTQVGVYATATVMPPSPTPFGTTAQCGRYYQAQSGDYCQRISLNNTISVPLFEQINPSINHDCTNLKPGFHYCVFPTQNWNQTLGGASSVTVGAPAPTPSGTTTTCYTWHIVKKGDYCAKLEQLYSVILAQLQLWNPQLDAACNNLLLGDAYCVLGE